MAPWLLRTLSAFTFVLVILPATARADADREKYDMGVVALHNKDCRAAADAFNSVEGPLSEDPSFVNYAAQANECAGNLEKALEYYRKKEVFDQNKLQAREKIGELLYRINKDKQAAAAANAQPTPESSVVFNPAGGVSGVINGQPFSLPLGGTGTGLQNVKFVVANDTQTFDLEVENADGKVECKGVTFLKPCSVKVRTGPARVQVTSGAHFTQNIEVPGSGCTVTITHDGAHGYLISGVACIGAGALLWAGGNKLGSNQPADSGGSVFTVLGAVYGGILGGTGLILILVDVYRDRNSATITGRSFGAEDSGFSPRLVGLAPVGYGRPQGAALVFEF